MVIFFIYFCPCHVSQVFFVPQLGKCVAQDASPAANITWLKNNVPLVADGKGIYSPSCFTNMQEWF